MKLQVALSDYIIPYTTDLTGKVLTRNSLARLAYKSSSEHEEGREANDF